MGGEWWRAGRAQLELSPGLPAGPPAASESALFSPRSIGRPRPRARAGSTPRSSAGSFTWSTARRTPSAAAAGAAAWSRWRRRGLRLCSPSRGPWYVPCPPGLGWVGCTWGSQSCSGPMQRRQGPQDRTLDGTSTRCCGFGSSGAACGESGHKSQGLPTIKLPLFWHQKTCCFCA